MKDTNLHRHFKTSILPGGWLNREKGGNVKTVYKTKYYTVKRDESYPTPKYRIYSGDKEVHTAKSQVEATMWVSKQNRKGR